MPAHNSRRVTPFGHPRIKALSAAPRGLSRPHTSFIGTACQGIHHTPMATNPPTPAKKGATGPCHLHWNTLRQLIRSSKHHPHQQCGRLTKTLANTIQHPQPNRRGWNGSTKSTVRTHPAHPTGHTVHARVHSPVLKPPHHTTPSTHPTQGHGQDGGNGTPPPTRGLAVREPNSMHHTTVHPHHKGAGALTFSQPARDTTQQEARL